RPLRRAGPGQRRHRSRDVDPRAGGDDRRADRLRRQARLGHRDAERPAAPSARCDPSGAPVRVPGSDATSRGARADDRVVSREHRHRRRVEILRPMRVAFVYPNPRAQLARAVDRGEAPDTGLLGQNHLAAFGIDAFIHDSILRRNHVIGGLGHRISWIAREATLPWELHDTDLVVTPLATFFPLAARLTRRSRVVVLSYGTLAAWERAGRARRRLLRR